MAIQPGDRVGAPDFDCPDGWVQAIRAPRRDEALESMIRVLHDDGRLDEWPVYRDHGCELRRVRNAPRLALFQHPVAAWQQVEPAAVASSATPPRARRRRKGLRR